MRVIRSNPASVAPPVGSYSHAVLAETGEATWIHVSGQVALDETGALVGQGDLAAQTKQVFENLRRILDACGASFDDVVKIQTFVTTFDGFAESREVRARYVPADPPASTAVRVAALVMPDAMIEVDLVAVVPGGKRREDMSDEKLIQEAQTFLGEGEQVIAAGIFQPRGPSGGTAGAAGAGFATDNLVGEIVGAAAAVESGRAMSHVDRVPRWTLLAVTPATLYAIASDQHGVGWQPKETFATFDRSKAHVTVHGRVNVRTLTVEDPDSGRAYQWEGNRIGPAHAKAVIEALDAKEVEPPEGDE